MNEGSQNLANAYHLPLLSLSLSLSLSGLFLLPQSFIHHYQVCGEKVERVGGGGAEKKKKAAMNRGGGQELRDAESL